MRYGAAKACSGFGAGIRRTRLFLRTLFLQAPKTSVNPLRWPIPALLAWGAAWLLYRLMISASLPLAAAFVLATAAGVVCSVFGATFWRKLVIAIGFPLSLLLSGAAGMPAWAWLVPLLAIALLYPVHAWRDAPLFPTPAQALAELPKHIRLPAGAAILDAGCGLGHGLKALRSVFPDARLFGIEWSWPLRAAAAFFCPWAKISQGDIWRADWSTYDLVYLFQRPESMPRAVVKAAVELKSGAWLVSLAFAADELEPAATIRGADGRLVWLYQLPFRRARER